MEGASPATVLGARNAKINLVDRTSGILIHLLGLFCDRGVTMVWVLEGAGPHWYLP